MRSRHGEMSRKEKLHWAAIKFDLLAEGARVSQQVWDALADSKFPIRTRSGVSGGLDIILNADVHVNVPVMEDYASNSRYLLDYVDDKFWVVQNGEALCTFTAQPLPAYYTKLLKTGEEMRRIGQMCSGDRFCYGMTGPSCYFWKKERRCQFCSIGKNYDADAARKQKKHFVEVLSEAVNDPRLPAKHVLIGGGTPPGADMGAILAAEYCREIKSLFPSLLTYVMIAAPLTNDYIDLLHDSGADELGMNLEFWSDKAWQNYIPGKNNEIGKQRYLDALEYAVTLFGPVNTRSILIAGVEDLNCTFEGAMHLAQMGVMPIISPFRPLNGTVLENRRGATGSDYLDLWERLDAEAQALGIPVGPTCIACQNNTLAMPFGERYHYY